LLFRNEFAFEIFKESKFVKYISYVRLFLDETIAGLTLIEMKYSPIRRLVTTTIIIVTSKRQIRITQDPLPEGNATCHQKVNRRNQIHQYVLIRIDKLQFWPEKCASGDKALFSEIVSIQRAHSRIETRWSAASMVKQYAFCRNLSTTLRRLLQVLRIILSLA
jgi:hypothetical protein